MGGMATTSELIGFEASAMVCPGSLIPSLLTTNSITWTRASEIEGAPMRSYKPVIASTTAFSLSISDSFPTFAGQKLSVGRGRK